MYQATTTGQIEAQVELWQSVRSFVERIADRPWVALVELVLIGSVVYFVLQFFHGTRGAGLVRAVLTILAVSFAVVWLIADKLESERIKVLYPYFVLGVFLVSLVAFQTELRRFLLRVGGGGWLQWWVKSSHQMIEPIVVAVERMSKKKIGALIAVAKSPELGLVTESGVRLDAIVSCELLETIFWPGAALHDLGVIIHDGRIVAAGCQFPLEESVDVDRSLGSRHRAAIGMSHELDAVVIVVSEETGTVSLAKRGRLRRALTSNALREALVKELTVETSKRKLARRKAVSTVAVGDTRKDGTGKAA